LNLVNEEGYYIPAGKVGTQRMILSSVSSRGLQRGSQCVNIFSEVEREFVGFLRGKTQNLMRSNADLKARLVVAQKAASDAKALYSRRVSEVDADRKRQVASAVGSLQQIRKEYATKTAESVMSSSRDALKSERELLQSQAKRNIEWLTSLYH
jgi:hypothetical protein